MFVIEVRNLTKSYGTKLVLDNLSFELSENEAVGILGANGAGKTTLLETIEGLRRVDSGEIKILGEDITKNSKKIQWQIGIQLQRTSLFENLSVAETISLYANLYERNEKVEILLEELDLLEQKDIYVQNLSGGQFQRLKLCLALINNPTILFLDEPTTGLDPSARSLIWDKVTDLKNKGTAIVLTTHYMEEAQAICGRIIILHQGKIIANDTPQNLLKKLDSPRTLILEIKSEFDEKWFSIFNVEFFKNEIYIRSDNIIEDLNKIFEVAKTHQVNIVNISIHEANLEDVFTKLTNTKLKDGEVVK